MNVFDLKRKSGRGSIQREKVIPINSIFTCKYKDVF
ncbi:uncharacterized protein PWA37_000630 [Arxiozyma heterogenica]